MEVVTQGHRDVLPSANDMETARSSLHTSLPEEGLGASSVEAHLRDDIVPGLTKSSQSPNYYGFVTGGATPAASIADHLVVDHDQNVSVHLPEEAITTLLEDRTLHMLCELLQLDSNQWTHRTFTTGATASNILGLACAREYVIQEAAVSVGKDVSVAEHGVFRATSLVGIREIQVLTTVPHSSMRKAASLVGLGRASVVDVGRSDMPHRFDHEKLKRCLQRPSTASIVAVSCAEVNTGFFATDQDDMQAIRKLCDQYGAWIHVDAAFGLLARVLPKSDEYGAIVKGVGALELADSITGDAHKLLNVVGLSISFLSAVCSHVLRLADSHSLTTVVSSFHVTCLLDLRFSRIQMLPT